MSEKFKTELKSKRTVTTTIAYKEPARNESGRETIAQFYIWMDVLHIENRAVNTLHFHIMSKPREPTKHEQRAFVANVGS